MERFKKWFENYWYHNKWPTLIVLLFVIVFAIGFGQIIGEKTNYDVYALYGGSHNLDAESHGAIVSVFKDAANKVDGGEDPEDPKDINVQTLIYLTGEEIAAQQKAAEEAGQEFTFNYLENNRVFDTFMKQLVSGENVIMVLSPYLYSSAESNEALYKVKDILGKDVPGMNSTGYGVKLSESGLTSKYPAFSHFPEDSIVCFRRVTHAMQLIGKSESQDSHQFQLDVARELFDGIKK